MATARISKVYPNGHEVHVEVEVNESYPDSVAEAVSEVIRLWMAVPDDAIDGDDD